MIPSQDLKIVQVTPPAAKVNNNYVGTAIIDTAGFSYCQIVVQVGDIDTDLSLSISQSDEDGMTDSDVLAAYGVDLGLDGNTADPPGATSDDKLFVFEVNLQGRKRYLDLSALVGNGSSGAYVAVLAILSRSRKGLISADERGAAQIVRV